ncbi:MAG: cysteine--tRNA ligase [bacterium]|nr:cysteine--tRNA ligase [bacterium]
MALQIYNVLGREKQPFEPLEAGQVKMYVCGPTVYDHAHIGHAKNYIAFDVVVKYLRFSGYKVLYVQNLTDVGHLLDTGEDRILKAARRTQALPMQLVEQYARSYFEDMDALGVARPDISPRASAHIPEQIKMIETLIAKGHAYVSEGSVYFDVTTDADYGKLSNRRIDTQQAGAREEIQVRGDKRNPEDFALWKFAEPEHILRWESPWGEGFPGWHIECSAMAKKYLGETFDIHGGGIDNIFPHNESEIAQSECANDAAFARYWMLVGSLTVDGVKMSKSLGNFLTIKDALKQYRPEVIRMFMAGVHYSSPFDYSDEAIQGVARAHERLTNAVRLTRRAMNTAPQTADGNAIVDVVRKTRADFTAAMDDDFNAPLALAALQELVRETNGLLNSGVTVGLDVLNAIHSAFSDLGGDVLGIVPKADEAAGGDAARETGLIELIINLRAEARAAKNWQESDRLRDALAKVGVVLEDRADGTIWKVS